MLEKKLEQGVGLFVAETDDALGEAWVEEEGFLAGCLEGFG
jgi:hypothetical protein